MDELRGGECVVAPEEPDTKGGNGRTARGGRGGKLGDISGIGIEVFIGRCAQ